MKRALSQATILLALAGVCGAAESGVPQAISASYEVSRNGRRVAVMNETFEANDGGYRIVSESHAVGLLALLERQPLRLTSSGRLTAAGLRPQLFEGKRGDADPRKVRADFDWQGKQLTIARDGRTDTLPLPPGTQDRLSAMYQFMFLVPDRSQKLEFSMTNGRKLDQYRYTVRSGVEIETRLGRMSTVHLVKQRRPDESGTEIWLAPHHRYLPIKLLILEEDGSRYEQVLTKLEIKP
jgi:hypothetical protein